MCSCCDIKFLVSYALTSSIMGCDHSAVLFVSSDTASIQNIYLQVFHQNHSNDQRKHDNIKEKTKPRSSENDHIMSYLLVVHIDLVAEPIILDMYQPSHVFYSMTI